MAGWTRVADVDEGATGDTTKQAVLDNESCVVDLYSNVNTLKKSFAATSAPSSPAPDEGQLFYNTAKDTLAAYDGTNWDNLMTVVNASGARLSTGLTTDETTLGTYTVPAGLMASGGILKATLLLNRNGVAGSKTLKVKVGVTTAHTIAMLNIAEISAIIIYLLPTGATAVDALVSSEGAPLYEYATVTQDITAAFALTVTGQCGSAADYMQSLAWFVELIKT